MRVGDGPDPQNEALLEAPDFRQFDFSSITTLDDGGISVTSGKFTLSCPPTSFPTLSPPFGSRLKRKRPIRPSAFSAYASVSLDVTSGFRPSARVFSSARTFLIWPYVNGLADDQKIALELDLRQFRKLPRSLKDECLTVIYDAANERLMVRSDVAKSTPVRLKLDVRPVGPESLSAEAVIGPIQHQGQLATSSLHKAVRFGQLFAERDLTWPRWPAIQISDGQSTSCLPSRAGVFSSAGLAGVQLGSKVQATENP